MHNGREVEYSARCVKKVLLTVGTLVVFGGAALWWSGSQPLAAPPPIAQTSWPRAEPPAGMQMFHLLTGTIARTAAFAYVGGSSGDKREFAMSALLIKHPAGDLLIDTGFSRDIDAKLQLMPWFFRAITKIQRRRSAAEQLSASGYDTKHLRAVVLTHAHWDHAAALSDFQRTPVWVTAVEREFIRDGGIPTVVARSATGVRYETYAFRDTPYLSFSHSYDVYSDGSIVIVPAPGHTPGSVIIFVAPPSGARYALVGDLVWQLEGLTQRRERPLLARTLIDDDAGANRAVIQQMSAIVQRFPDLKVIPAHDLRAYSSLPTLASDPSSRQVE